VNRSDVIGSAVIHGAILAGVLVARMNEPMVVPGPDVVQVALLDPNMSMPVLPAAAPPPPEPKEEPTIAPTEDEGVRIEKPKPPKEKQPEPPPVPPKETPPRTVALPYAAVGPQGLRGEVSVDAADFEFTYYLIQVRNRIVQNWTAPGNGRAMRTVVYFRINRNGAVLEPRIEQSSGNEYFDFAATHAVQISHPLPPLPLGWPGSDLGVHFGFEYTGE
jgi:TonB family protein